MIPESGQEADVERANGGCSTELEDWVGRLADVERVEDGSTELTDIEDRPPVEECTDGSCSCTVWAD